MEFTRQFPVVDTSMNLCFKQNYLYKKIFSEELSQQRIFPPYSGTFSGSVKLYPCEDFHGMEREHFALFRWNFGETFCTKNIPIPIDPSVLKIK